MNSIEITRFCKGIAILFVVLCHSHQTFALPTPMNSIFSFFQIGVQLFMLLSAMGLCFSYSKSPVNWLDFFKILATVYRVAFAVFTHKNILQEINPIGILINALCLHGFSSDNVINNHIVRGGWFVGTLIILYALFPVIYRVYFLKNIRWKKVRLFVFPIIILFISTFGVIAFKRFLPDHSLSKLFLQLPPFALGFPLFELQKNNTVKSIKFPIIKSVFFVILAIVAYFLKTMFSFIYVFSIGFAFFYCIIYLLQNENITKTINGKFLVCKFFKAMGKYSFSIYLTQSFVAFDFCYVLNAVLSRIYSNDLLWFVLLQPIVITTAYFVAKVFEITTNYCQSKIASALKSKKK